MRNILENMPKLADDIVLTEQEKRKVFTAYKKRIEVQKRKAAIVRKIYQAVAVIVVLVTIITFSTTYLQSSNLVVYAATGDKMVQLKLNEKVYLEKEKTPLGYGYTLEMSVEEKGYYYTIEGEENLNADNIFRNENRIYWMPDGMNTMNFRDQDGNIIQIPETNNSTLNIKVCNSEGRQVEKITLILERRDGKCSVEMLKK